MHNKTFTIGNISTNACVGNNGFVDGRTYAYGFAEAVDKLTSATINRDATIDAVIYPICFCARHYIELFLKYNVKKISWIRNIELNIRFETTHDLQTLWKELNDICQKTDDRFLIHLDRIKDVVYDFSQIDPTGQTFRYPYNNESHKHLTNTSIINIEILKHRFDEFYRVSDEFSDHVDLIISEYQLGTYTEKLSRADIENIASNLPDYKFWSDDSFKEKKNDIKSKYKIGSKELSQAISIIKNHRKFCTFIGLEEKIKEVSISTLRKIEKINKEDPLSKNISLMEIAGLLSIIDLHQSDYHCEEYDATIKNYLPILGNNEAKEYFIEKILRSSRQLIKGMDKLGQHTLLHEFKNRTKHVLKRKRKIDHEGWVKLNRKIRKFSITKTSGH